MTSTRESLRVWSWYSYDPGLDQQVVFAVAAHGPAELRDVRSRLRLPEPTVSAQMHPSTPGYTQAAADPLHALWMPLDQFAARGTHWLGEPQLAAARLRQFPDLTRPEQASPAEIAVEGQL
jgi:hypothetical protein